MSSSLWGGQGQATGQPSRQGLTGGNKIPAGYKRAQLQNFTPEQMDLLSQLSSLLGPDSQLMKLIGGDEEAFSQMEAPAMRQFNELLGGISSRFSGMGDTGGRHSSGYGHATTSAASNFAQDLASKRQGLMRDARQDLFSYGNQLMQQRPYEQQLVKKPASWLEQVLSAGAGGVTGGIQGYAQGGWPGAGVGASKGAYEGYKGTL